MSSMRPGPSLCSRSRRPRAGHTGTRLCSSERQCLDAHGDARKGQRVRSWQVTVPDAAWGRSRPQALGLCVPTLQLPGAPAAQPSALVHLPLAAGWGSLPPLLMFAWPRDHLDRRAEHASGPRPAPGAAPGAFLPPQSREPALGPDDPSSMACSLSSCL